MIVVVTSVDLKNSIVQLDLTSLTKWSNRPSVSPGSSKISNTGVIAFKDIALNTLPVLILLDGLFRTVFKAVVGGFVLSSFGTEGRRLPGSVGRVSNKGAGGDGEGAELHGLCL